MPRAKQTVIGTAKGESRKGPEGVAHSNADATGRVCLRELLSRVPVNGGAVNLLDKMMR